MQKKKTKARQPPKQRQRRQRLEDRAGFSDSEKDEAAFLLGDDPAAPVKQKHLSEAPFDADTPNLCLSLPHFTLREEETKTVTVVVPEDCDLGQLLVGGGGWLGSEVQIDDVLIGPRRVAGPIAAATLRNTTMMRREQRTRLLRGDMLTLVVSRRITPIVIKALCVRHPKGR